MGYFPNNDSGDGTGYYLDNNAYVGRNSHRLQVLDGTGALIVTNDYASAGLAGEANNLTFTLPLNDADPNSWETGIRVRVFARSGPTTLYSKLYLGPGGGNLRHPSAKLSDLSFDNTVVPSDPPGNYPGSFTDDRPTAQTNHYAYDLFRRNFGPVTTTQVNQYDHGHIGSHPETFVHPVTTRPITLPVLAGQQIFWLRPRLSYKNSFGTNIGRFDIAPKSENIAVETTEPE